MFWYEKSHIVTLGNAQYVYYMCDNITKLPESGDLCGNITEFEAVEGSPELPGL